jgi:two-component system chemotaxis response regulator CheB
MNSALTKEGATTTFDALKYGAIDVIAKPSRRQNVSLDAQREDIINKVKRAAAIRTGRSRYIRMSGGKAGALRPTGEPPNAMTRFIGLGAGTGGYYSLLRIIPSLGSDFSDVIIAVILVSARYVEPFVTYLASHSPIRVKTVKEGRTVEKGTVYVCSGQDGPIISADGDGMLRLRLTKITSEFVEGGAIDRMFQSLAAIAGPKTVGCVLSGPGNDGAEGIHEVGRAGGITVVQDINNCMDPSMPLAVLKKGTVEKIIPDFLMADFLVNPEAHREN